MSVLLFVLGLDMLTVRVVGGFGRVNLSGDGKGGGDATVAAIAASSSFLH